MVVNDSLNNLFSVFSAFDETAVCMLNAQNMGEFIKNFEKCIDLDRRCTLLFMQKHIKKFPRDYIHFVQWYIERGRVPVNGKRRLNISWKEN